MGLISCDIWFEAPSEFSHCLLTHLVQTAPSQVSGVMKERVLQRSVELSWQEPEHPNGVITEYEIKYYEKVSVRELRCEQCRAWHHPTALDSSAGHYTTIWGYFTIHTHDSLCLITIFSNLGSHYNQDSIYLLSVSYKWDYWQYIFSVFYIIIRYRML